jgi:short-subunit dehydrogenase
MPSTRTAVVTGATAGIGAAFARRLARDGQDLILVARDGERLAQTAQDLSDRYAIHATPLTADLLTDEGLAAVDRVLREQRIDLLVNNAGLSLNKSFLKSTLEEEMRLMRLNVLAVLHLTNAALPAMLERGSGDIINVSSVSGFATTMPGTTYPASKAWVTSFSESVGMATRPRGVRVMALCPGFTRTEFHQRAGINTSKMPGYLWLDADSVVAESLRDLRKGKLVSVPSVRYKLIVGALKVTPRGLLHRFAGKGAARLGRTVGDSQ